MWPGPHHHFERPVLVVEVRNQHLDDDLGILGPHGFDGMLKMFGAAVLEIVPCHGGYHDVIKLHPPGRLSDPFGFVRFQSIRFGSLHCTEATGPRAFLPRYHESRRPLPPTLPTVGALGLFTHGDEIEVLDERLRIPKDGIIGQPNLEPFRLLLLVERRVHFHAGAKDPTFAATATAHGRFLLLICAKSNAGCYHKIAWSSVDRLSSEQSFHHTAQFPGPTEPPPHGKRPSWERLRKPHPDYKLSW